MISIRRSISILIVRGGATGISQGMNAKGRIQGMILAGAAQGGRTTGPEGGVTAGSTVTGIHPGLGRVEVRIDVVTVDHLHLNHGHLIGSLGHPHKIKRGKCLLLISWLNISESNHYTLIRKNA